VVVSQRRGKEEGWWVCRVGAPFAQLIIGGVKLLETRVDFRSKPRHLPRLKPGTRVLVYYDENWFPPGASAQQKEQTEYDIQQLLSRQHKSIRFTPTAEQQGTISGWFRVGNHFALTEQEVQSRGGWDKVEELALLKRGFLGYNGDPASCRFAIEVLESGLLREPIQMTEAMLTATGLFELPADVTIDQSDLLPLPEHQRCVTAAPQPCSGPSAPASRGLVSGSFLQVARDGHARSSGASSSSASPTKPAGRGAGTAGRGAGTAGRKAISAAGTLSAKQAGKLPSSGSTVAKPRSPAPASTAPAPAPPGAPAMATATATVTATAMATATATESGLATAQEPEPEPAPAQESAPEPAPDREPAPRPDQEPTAAPASAPAPQQLPAAAPPIPSSAALAEAPASPAAAPTMAAGAPAWVPPCAKDAAQAMVNMQATAPCTVSLPNPSFMSVPLQLGQRQHPGRFGSSAHPPTPRHGPPWRVDPTTGARLNSYGRVYQAPPPPGQRGPNGGSRSTVRRREKQRQVRAWQESGHWQQMQHDPPVGATACHFASLSEMLTAAAAESHGLDVGEVEKVLSTGGYNAAGLFNEMVTGGDESLLGVLRALGIGALGHQRAILRVLKYE